MSARVTKSNGVTETYYEIVTVKNRLQILITKPKKNSTIRKTITILPQILGGEKIKKVEFFRGKTRIATKIRSPYSTAWNTRRAENGIYTLRVTVTDTKNTRASVSIRVRVKN
jgi:hypothetical protein